MNFTTQVPISKYENLMDYNSIIMSLGSCFAENMSEKFSYFKFQNAVNPFGIIFNPISIETIVLRIRNKTEFTEKDIFFHDGLWHCYEVHSALSKPDKEDYLDYLNQMLQQSYNSLVAATHLIITYGTSWVYRNKESGRIVANCHKVPQNEFDKEMVSIDSIQKSIENTINTIHEINPKCSFIFTISPVRHTKDGFVENQRSKSHLIASLQSVLFSKAAANYFPSFEIMMDELRDYRFYADDMLHPSTTAIDYIWSKFFENYISESEFEAMHQVCEIQRALQHRALHPTSELHLKFLEKVNIKINILVELYPNIKF